MKNPQIHADCVLLPGTVVLGDVTIGADSSVWFGSVLRAEHDRMVIGARTNIQDNCVLHVDNGHRCTLGDGVTVGHGAIVHGCTVGDNTLVGMGAVILNDAVVGKDCIVGARALVTQGKHIPAGSLVMGVPAKVVRPLTPEEIEGNRRSAGHYVEEAREVAAHLAAHPLKER